MSTKVQTLERIITILDCFSLEEPVLGVRAVARKTGLSSSTTGRLMANMKDYGILAQEIESLEYMIGARILGWAGIYSATSDLRTLALPVMVHLQEQTHLPKM